MENYTYPRVSMSTTALRRSAVGPAVEDTTVLFAPIMAKRGPADKIVVCHSLSEFIDTFGDLNYKENKLQAFNVYNWLSNGGTVYAKRLLIEGAARAFSGNDLNSATYIAKYEGSWYNNLKVAVKAREGLSGYFDVTVKYVENNKTTVLENFYRIKGDNFQAALAGSQFIEVGPGTISLSESAEDYSFSGGDDGISASGIDTLDKLIEVYFSGEAANVDLGNALETPVDLILDAGFSDLTKKAIADFVAGSGANKSSVGPLSSAVRPDIIAIFDRYGINRQSSNEELIECTTMDGVCATNIALYDQFFTVYDAIFSDMDVKVCPSYFLSKLIPFNDLQYGIQLPTAGLRRGVLDDAIAINKNPRPAEKETLFKDRINYVEKTSREYAFMSQRTHDGSSEVEYTALSFLNNSRCLEKMKKELERLGREYLFEFNDSATLSQLSNILNKYIGGWISNRTLSYGVVQVAQDPYSTERVNVTLNIKFTGTIEVISVDIIIE